MNRIRELRKSKRLSQMELAEILHVSQSSLSGYERGAFEPEIDTLKAIADYFKVSIDYVVGGSADNVVPFSGSVNIAETEEPTPIEAMPSEEWRSLAPGWHNMTKEERQRVVAVVKAMYPDRFKRKG